MRHAFKVLIFVLSVIVAYIAGSLQADAAQCAPAEAVHEGLSRNYGETPQATGEAADGAVMALYANEETGTWTLLVVTVGQACLVASGGGFVRVPGEPNV
jgi:hypothetical protein